MLNLEYTVCFFVTNNNRDNINVHQQFTVVFLFFLLNFPLYTIATQIQINLLFSLNCYFIFSYLMLLVFSICVLYKEKRGILKNYDTLLLYSISNAKKIELCIKKYCIS